MADFPETIMSKEEQEEIKEFVAALLLLPKEDRAILLSNANAFRVRSDIDRARGPRKQREAAHQACIK